MGIRWRLSVLAVQLLLLLLATYLSTGRVITGDAWFLAGLFAIVVNPQLLEPWYPRPQDVLVNSLIGIALAFLASRTTAAVGWLILLGFLTITAMVALLALALGASRTEGAGVPVGRGARTISRIGSAAVIYSSVFWLALLDYRPQLDGPFWLLGGAWATLLLIGKINWQAVWATATGSPLPCVPEGMMGPSILMVSSTNVPPSGSWVRVTDGDVSADGVVITRIQRASDAWAEVFVLEPKACEELVRKPALTIAVSDRGPSDVVGAVDAGSTDRILRFITTAALQVGEVVRVREASRDVLYQISHAEVDRSAVRGGAHLIVRARAGQVGEYDAVTGYIRRHQWVPGPGHAVRRASDAHVAPPQVPETWISLGSVLGTNVPVYIDGDAACEGHVVILGMTRMGKTTFAVRLAEALGQTRSVIILDQTGEYTKKRGLGPLRAGDETRPGVSVFEPEPGEVPADRALQCLEWLVGQAVEEYKNGDPRRRVVLIEEAHQFVPEPAGLGFSAPGRDSAYKFGLLMMQVRKYGLSIILISQRTAVVAKSALSQCENVIAFKSVDQTGLDYLEALMGSEARALLPTLKQGQALVFGPAFSTDGPVVISVDQPPPTAAARPEEMAAQAAPSDLGRAHSEADGGIATA